MSMVEPLMPARQTFAQNPAPRPVPAVAVAREQWDKLPFNPQNKCLNKAAFVYEAEKDRYLCPAGQTLGYSHDKPCNRDGGKGTDRITNVRLAPAVRCRRCLPKGASERRVGRDEFEAQGEGRKAV